MNRKVTPLALVAVVGFGAATIAAAHAAVASTTPPPTKPGCTSDCGGGGDGDGPFDPFCMFEPCKSDEGSTPTPECDDLAPCDVPEACVGPDCDVPDPDCLVDCGPGPGNGIPGNHAGLKLCDAQIGDLKKVTAKQVKGISGRDDVQVVPVCLEKNLIEQQQGVENLRTAIAQNDNMDAALDETGYVADDVVGLVVGRTAAVLYVHTY
jgi:hypothetical protein